MIDWFGLALSTIYVGVGLYMVGTDRTVRLLPFRRHVIKARLHGWAIMLIAAYFPLVILGQELGPSYEGRTIMLVLPLACLLSGVWIATRNSRSQIHHDGIDRRLPG
ncbi:hypothetical protein [Nonomuraea sp. bgisy101]|uniref:hypothetical protein n=1 Tax=Nonomuraea sp. bgisy101 TaxID=3413784 RepID=UPI003D75FE4F